MPTLGDSASLQAASRASAWWARSITSGEAS
jgi:hypothetical protein